MHFNRKRLCALSAPLLLWACSPSSEGTNTREDLDSVGIRDSGSDPADGDAAPSSVGSTPDKTPTKPGDDGADDGTDRDAAAPPSSDGGRGDAGGAPGPEPDAGPATSADSGVDASTPPSCDTGYCCIGGREYLPGVKNPEAACEVCQPERDQHGFSPASGISCGTGCTCTDGRQSEILCDDRTDNDEDGRLNCADADCAGKLCQARTTTQAYPSRDVLVSMGPLGEKVTDGGTTIALVSRPIGSSHARLEFDNIADDGSLTIASAVLNVYVESSGVRIAVRSPDGREIDDPAGNAGYRQVDVTALVRSWADGSETQRFLTIHWDNGAQGETTIRATEYEGSGSDPYLYLSYEARCSAGLCPEP